MVSTEYWVLFTGYLVLGTRYELLYAEILTGINKNNLINSKIPRSLEF